MATRRLGASAGGAVRATGQALSGRALTARRWFYHQLMAKSATSRVSPVDEDDHGVAKSTRVEAALFLCKEGLTSRKLAVLAGLADATEARTLIRQLNEQYDTQGRAFRIEEIAGGYALMTRGSFAPWLQKMGSVPSSRKLSQTAMETLAIVAYRQPVPRAEIEAIRGVGCSEVLKQLMEYELVKISGRSEELGRPYLYGTTRRFLQMFGLRSTDRLPRMSWVNEPIETSIIVSPSEPQSEAEDSAMTHTTILSDLEMDGSELQSGNGATLSAGTTAVLDATANQEVRAVDDDEDEDFYDEDYDDDEEDDEEDEFGDEDFGDDDDEDWDDDESDDESDDDDDDEDDSDDIEEGSEWEEVDDDDDGWVDEDDDEEEDDWEEESEEDWD